MEGSPSLSSGSSGGAGNAAIESGVCKYCKGTGELRSWKKPPAGPAGAAVGGGGDSTSTSPSHQPHRLPGIEEPAAAVAVAAAGRPDPVPGRLSRASSFLADDPASLYADSSSPGAAPVVSSSRERFPGEAQALSYLSLDYGSDIVRRFHWSAAGDFDAGARYTPLETPSLRYDDAQQSLASVSEDGSSQVEGSSVSSSIEEHYSSASVLQGLRISYDGTALERSFGYPAHLVGTSLQWWENRIHSDDKPRVLLSLKRALESEHARYWAESYRFRIYRPPPFSSSTRPPGARFRAPPSSSPQSGGLYQASGSRPVQPAMSRTVSTVSATSNNSSNTSGNSNTPTEVGGDYYSSGSSSGSSARRQHGVDHPEDYITVLDQLYITRAPGTRKPTHALGVMCSAEQRVKIAEALHAPRSALLRSLPKGGVSYIGSEIIGTILQNTASGLFMMDANGYPTYMNQAASDITGYLSIDEISNAPLHYAVHYKRPDGTDYPMEECPLDNANATLSRVQNQTEVFVKKDGTLFPVVWSCAPLERLGKTVGAVIEFRDVTEERKLEQDRFQATLTSKQQQIRIKEAESHRQRMSQFVDYIAHELRNPLHGISANIDFLRDSLQAVQSAVQVYNANLEGGPELPPMTTASRPSSYLASHDQILLRGNREALTGSPSLPTSPLAGGTRGPSHRASYQDLSQTPFGAHFKGSHTTQPWQAETKHSKASGQGSVPPLLSDFTTSTQSVGASATGPASMSGSGQQGPISPSLAHPAPQQLQQKTGGSAVSMSESVSSSAMLSDMPSSSGRASPSLGYSTPILDIQQSLTTSQSFIASIYECVSHATHITNNVLDLSRLEAGKVELLHDLVQPNRVANLAMDMMGARAQEKDISLSLSGPTEATLIRGDGTRLAQIFLNLISNAIKFTPPGGHVSVTFRLEPAGERILLSGSVTDSGVGMSEEEMGNLFQRFGQSSRSIQAEYGGTGLGLSICQEIVTLQGGRMKVDSRKGEGSTFTFTSYYTPASEEDIREYHRQTPSQSRRNSDSRTTTLSSKKEDDVQDVTKLAMQNFMPILADASSSGTPTTPSLLSSDQRKNYFKIKERIESVQKAQEPYKFKHILVAEDNSINQNIMRTYLKKLGYAFTVVGNGQEALDMVINKNEGGTVDVILMDCEMPILDGRQATSRIRQHEAHSKLLVAPIDSPFDLHATAYNINFASQQQQGPSVLHPLGTASPGTIALNRRIPIIGLSGNARRELIEEAFVAGMDDYVVKPFKLPELEKVLKKWENVIESRMLAASSRDIVRDVLGMDLASPSSTTPTDARPSLISRPSKSRLSGGEMWHAEAEQPEPPRLVSPHSSASTVPSLSSRTSSVQPTEINTPPPGRGEGATSEDMKEQDYA